MTRLDSPYILAQPARRPLRIFASDPMLAHTPGNRITIDIPNEPLQIGPVGSRFAVIDYDGDKKCFYPPVNLDDDAILIQNGLEPTESDPRFHQQMVYAIAMRTLENFERALGRRLEFYTPGSKHSPLRLFPHAFYGANAYYDPVLNGILFGYFCADRRDPGPNLPGQIVFTCLSHDIIVHEFTHAVVNRLRRYFIEPSNPDVLAFHEGFSDIVALFQHFTFQEFLRDEIQKTQGAIRSGKKLVDLARQFGYASGLNQSLRSAIDIGTEEGGKAPRRLSPGILEVHDRGSILVAAVFDGFYNTYQARIRDLIRIATNGSGVLPSGDMHPDLVNRLAHEASRTAQAVLTMCIRAFDYLPPVDITFGDYLRALVTADYELNPADENGLRSAMIEAFRVRGIYPENVRSLAEESLIWKEPTMDMDRLDPHCFNLLRESPRDMDHGDARCQDLSQEIYQSAVAFSMDPFRRNDPITKKPVSILSGFSSTDEREAKGELAGRLSAYAMENAYALNLDPKASKIQVNGFHPVFRISQGGQMLTELVIQFSQCQRKENMGGIPFRSGTTVVAAADGQIRYIISKPPDSENIEKTAREKGNQRLDRQFEYLNGADLADLNMAYGSEDYIKRRAISRMRSAMLHQGADL